MKVERRFFSFTPEVRAAQAAGYIGTLVGYAAVFNSESQDFGGWREVLKPGCFTRSLKENPDVFMFFQHDVHAVMARAKAGNLRVAEDDKGLRIEADLVDTSLNRDALANIRAGNIDSMSFGMYADSVVSSWERRSGYDLRTVTEAHLIEVSAVTFPAYTATEIVSQRAHDAFRTSSSAVFPRSLVRARVERAKL